jgi:hypothetical protein
LNTLEELIVVDTTLGGLLIGVVLKDLLAVGLLDLVFSSPPAVLRKTENLVVILGLVTKKKNVNKSTRVAYQKAHTFQSLASRWSIMGSSGSLSSLTSPSSTFLALS